MTATLDVTPNPVLPGKRLDINGAGFSPSSGVRVSLDGTSYVASVYPAHDGTFHFAIPTPIGRDGPHIVTATVGGNAVATARVTVAVPPPPPPPPPTGPTITAIAAAPTATTAVVSWTLSEKATGQVEYGLDATYGKASVPETSLNYAAHVQTITGLTPGTLYHFRVRSKNAAGIETISGDGTFTTTGAVPPPPPPPPPPPSGTTPLPPSVKVFAGTGLDAADAIANFLNGVPPSTHVVVPDKYTVAKAVGLTARSALDLDFAQTGELKSIAPLSGYNENFSPIYFHSFSGGNHGCKVHGGHIAGSSPTPGIFVSGKEGQHGILADGGSDYEFYDLTIDSCWGDAIEVNSHADKVAIHDFRVPNIGRNAVSSIMGTNIEIWNFVFGKMGYMPFDLEPNNPGEPTSGVYLHDGTVDLFTNAFFAADGPSKPNDSDIHDVRIERVTVTGAGLAAWKAKDPLTQASLLSIVDIVATTRRKNFYFGDLTCLIPVSGIQFKMAHVDGLTLKNLRDPNGPVQYSVTDCPLASIAV